MLLGVVEGLESPLHILILALIGLVAYCIYRKVSSGNRQRNEPTRRERFLEAEIEQLREENASLQQELAKQCDPQLAKQRDPHIQAKKPSE